MRRLFRTKGSVFGMHLTEQEGRKGRRKIREKQGLFGSRAELRQWNDS